MISYIGVKIQHKIGGQKTYWLILVSCLIFTFHCSNTAVMYCSIIYVRFKLFFLLFILFVLFVWEKPRGVVCTLRLTERIQLQIITQQTLVFQNIKFKVEFPVSKMATLSLSLSLIVTFVLILHSWKPILILLNFPISEVAKSSSSVVSVWTHSTLMNTPIVTLSDFLKAARRVAARQCLVKLLGGAQARQYITNFIIALCACFFFFLFSSALSSSEAAWGRSGSPIHHCVRIPLLIIIFLSSTFSSFSSTLLSFG